MPAPATLHQLSGDTLAQCAETMIRPLHGRLHSLRGRNQTYGTVGKTAIVLSGGGTRGALHVGGLRALLEAGVRPDMVIGTSIGAWNAAWLARNPTLAGLDELAQLWCSLRPADILLGGEPRLRLPVAERYRIAWNALRRVLGRRSSLYGSRGLADVLHRQFGSATFADLQLPLHVVAADLTHGGRAVFNAGPLVPAVLASSAIPGIFPPVRIGQAFYADGGTVDGCSIETAVDLGARRIVVLAIGYDTEGEGSARWHTSPDESAGRWERERRCSVASTIQRASQIMGNYQITRALERVPAGTETHVISLSAGSGGGSLSFNDIPTWIEAAYTDARRQLAHASREADARLAHGAALATPRSA